MGVFAHLFNIQRPGLEKVSSSFFLYLPVGDGEEELKIRAEKDKIGNKAFHHHVYSVCVSIWTGERVCSPSSSSVEDIY